MKTLFLRWYLPVLFMGLLLYTAKINWNDGQWQRILRVDARGYYAYLPAVFIYGDLQYGFYDDLESKYSNDSNLVYDYRTYVEGKTLNKYTMGVAVMQSPFFLGAHLLSNISGSEADGYSQYYLVSISLAALIYLFLGLFYLRKWLRLYNFKETTIALSLISFVLGSHLFYYSIGEPGMSHVYSFALICIFLFQATKYFQGGESKRVVWLFLLLGLIILIRPINFILLLSIPFLAGNLENFKEKYRLHFKNYSVLFFSLVVFTLVVGFQNLIYYSQTGHVLVDTYPNEGFHFMNAHFIDFLFSFRKGLFIYTPICLLSLVGFIALYKNRFSFWFLIVFMISVVYLFSSWWIWYYGGSFSARAMVEYLPFFIFLIALAFDHMEKNSMRWLFFISMFLMIVLNQVQTLQYRYNIIHWSDMSKERYMDIFLDLNPVIKQKKQ